MTKSEFAFRASCLKLQRQCPKLYFWTFTFRAVMPDWYYSNTWSRFIRVLQDLYGGQLRGLKVTELHKSHGIHYHCLLNQRVWVGEVRRIGKRFGIGRVHVVHADATSVPYLAKYLSKDYRNGTKLFARIPRWNTIGLFRGTRKRDVICSSPFHDAMKEFGALYPGGKVPYPLARRLMAGYSNAQTMRELWQYARTDAMMKTVRNRHIQSDEDRIPEIVQQQSRRPRGHYLPYKD